MVNPFFTAPTLNTIPAPAPIEVRKTFTPQIVDYVSSGNGYTVARMSDGTTQTLRGTRADRNNNPGNLTGTLAGAQRRGAIGVDHGGNYIFPTAEAGRKAMAEMVLNENANKSIGEMLNMYAPPGAANDPNDTNRLYPSLIAQQGFNLGDRVGALAPQQQQALLGAMMGVEGYSGMPAAASLAVPAAAPVNPMMRRAQAAGVPQAATPQFAPVENPMAQRAQALVATPPMPMPQPQENPMIRRAQAQAQVQAPADSQPVQRPRMAVGAGRAEAQELGLFGNPQVASAVAETTASAVDKVSASDEAPKPLTKKERERFSPRSLGLIAFGLSLMGGADISDAMQNGIDIYEGLQNRKDRKERQAAIDAFIEKQDPETQDLMRLVGDDVNSVANIALSQQQQEAAAAEKQVTQRAERQGLFKEATRELDSLNTATNDALSVLDKAIAAAQVFVDGAIPFDAQRVEAFKGFAGTSEAALFESLEAVKAFTAFSTLQAMREASKTGGALGNVSNVELGLLQSAMGSLSYKQGIPQLLANMQEIKQRVLEQQQRGTRYYYEDFGEEFGVSPARQQERDTPSEASKPGDLLGTYGNAKVYAG